MTLWQVAEGVLVNIYFTKAGRRPHQGVLYLNCSSLTTYVLSDRGAEIWGHPRLHPVRRSAQGQDTAAHAGELFGSSSKLG